MFHRITIIGFVGQAPQMRYTEDGTPVTNFSVATRRLPHWLEGIPQRQELGTHDMVQGDVLAQAGGGRERVPGQRPTGLCGR
jgi:hypothetical protein